MSKKRIVVGINSLTESQYPAYNNHIRYFFQLGKNNPDLEICLVNPARVGIDRMRNSAATICLTGGYDYLYFIDDDVLVPLDAFEKLMKCDADIAAGDVIIRGYPFNHMAFKYKDKKKSILQAIDYFQPTVRYVNVDAVGFSCCLIKRELLEQVPEPYFITGVNHTEDVYFCLKAREANPKCTIRVDTDLVCGHILWPEIISSENKVAYKKYMETMDKDLKKKEQITKLPIIKVPKDFTYEQVMRQSMVKK